jgi:glycosyltransferase involved in cell wall biosynthesis
MEVSVVIPVYSAELFLEKAVESALIQEETVEILLVEDGSLDGSFDLCTSLEHEHESAMLVRHPDGGNRGAGAARNLGIKSASSGFIAFLDADDLYLPGRFGTAREIFSEQPGVDGVYEATGTMYESPEAKAIFFLDLNISCSIARENVPCLSV